MNVVRIPEFVKRAYVTSRNQVNDRLGLSELRAQMAAVTLELRKGQEARETPVTIATNALCTAVQCHGADFEGWCMELGQTPRYHRKMWEYVWICRALEQRGMLSANKRGLGFATGQEPLPGLFARRGCTIIATDLDAAAPEAQAWIATGQHRGAAVTQQTSIVEPVAGGSVSHQAADMRNIPDHLRDFDFVWSSCAFEHLGTLDEGLRFVEQAMRCVKPGGVAVHTTEFNVSSNDATLSTGPVVLYRKQDVEKLVARLQAAGHTVEPFDWSTGDSLVDTFVDTGPYLSLPHLKLKIGDYVATSAGIIITKAQDTTGR